MERPGTFQQYVTSQADYVTPIPENLSSEDAAVGLIPSVLLQNPMELFEGAAAAAGE